MAIRKPGTHFAGIYWDTSIYKQGLMRFLKGLIGIYVALVKGFQSVMAVMVYNYWDLFLERDLFGLKGPRAGMFEGTFEDICWDTGNRLCKTLRLVGVFPSQPRLIPRFSLKQLWGMSHENDWWAVLGSSYHYSIMLSDFLRIIISHFLRFVSLQIYYHYHYQFLSLSFT